jgi:hypothetical protein
MQEDPRHHNRRIVKDARVVLAPEQCGAAAAAAASEEAMPFAATQHQSITVYNVLSQCLDLLHASVSNVDAAVGFSTVVAAAAAAERARLSMRLFALEPSSRL